LGRGVKLIKARLRMKKVTIEIDYDIQDAITLASLKDTLAVLKMDAKQYPHDKCLKDDLAAAKRMVKYYGG